MTNEPWAILRRLGDQVVVYEACFNSTLKATHTLHYFSEAGVHTYVDVNESDPISIKFIHSPSVPINYRRVPKGTQNFLRTAYKLAVELVLIDKLGSESRLVDGEQDLRNQLIDEETKGEVEYGELATGCSSN